MASTKPKKSIDYSPSDWRQLQQMNNEQFEGVSDDVAEILRGPAIRSAYDPYMAGEQYISSPLAQSGIGLGESRFDEKSYNEDEFEHAQDVRAENQPWLSKLGAGLAKSQITAATTFLDGTLGLLAGVGESLSRIGDGKGATHVIEGLWDNVVSNGLQQVNEKMEEWFPNYRTEEEQNSHWWQNLDTVNFWADNVLKNFGFTIGAMYSGSAFTKALKGAKLLKGDLGAQIIGSVYSAINEARIEANNNSDDWEKLERQKLDDAFSEALQNPDADQDVLYERYTSELENLKDRKAKMGLTDFLGNTVLLSIDNFGTFGKIYSRGFNETARGLGRDLKDLVSREAVEGGFKYVANPKSAGKLLAKGLGIGIKEGNEEIAQAFISEYSGNRQSYDSPDSYYASLIDDNAQAQTNDFISSVTKGFADTYLNPDKYEEFAVGFLTGLVGVPTVGKASNSSAQTYLGNGKSVGMTGGLFGTLSEGRQLNSDAQEAAEAMNNYVSDMNLRRSMLQQSQSFTNAMDGWVEARIDGTDEDKAVAEFEFNNAKDNDTFNVISRFSRTGRMSDLYDIVDQSFEDMSQEELEQIASTTTNENGSGWTNVDGTLMTDTEQGTEEMRKKLIEKRDQMKKEISLYEDSLRQIRGMGYRGLDSDREAELAWLMWKVNKFNDRYNDIQKTKNEDFRALFESIAEYDSSLRSELSELENESEPDKEEISKISKMIEGNSNVQKLMENFISGKNMLNLSDKNVQKGLSVLMDKELMDMYLPASSMDGVKFAETIKNIQDLYRIASARNTFQERLKKFMENPIEEIEKNRRRIDNKRKAQTEANTIVRDNAEFSNLTSNDIANMESSKRDALQKKIEEGTIEDKDGKMKEGIDMYNISQSLMSHLESLENISAESKDNAAEAISNALQNSESVKELLNSGSEAYQTILDNIPDELLKAEVQTALNDVIELTAKENEELAGIYFSAVNNPVEDNDITEIMANASDAERYSDSPAQTAPVTEPMQPADNPAGVDAEQLADFVIENGPEGLDNDIKTLASYIDLLKKKGYTMEQTHEAIIANRKGNQTAQNLMDAVPNFPEFLAEMIALSYNGEQTSTLDRSKIDPAPAKASEEQYVSPKAPSTVSKFKRSTTRYALYSNNDPSTRLTTPYWRTLDDSNPMKSRYKAVYEYLSTNEAFDNLDKGIVKPGDEIHFKTDSLLNKSAGDMIVLITDKNGVVIGDFDLLSTDEDIMALAEEFKNEYKGHEEESEYVFSRKETIDQMMYGSIPYDYSSNGTRIYHTLTDALGEYSKDSRWKLGVSLGNNEFTTSTSSNNITGQDILNRDVIGNITKGRPVILLDSGVKDKAGRSMRVVIPINTPTYDSQSQGNTMFSTVLRKALEGVRTRKITDTKDMLNSLFNFSVGGIKYDLRIITEDSTSTYKGNNGTKITVKRLFSEPFTKLVLYNGNNSMTLYESQGSEVSVDDMMNAFNGFPIKVDIHSMNSDISLLGMDVNYNNMIGELGMVNLVPGTDSLVGNWFTFTHSDNAENKTKASEQTSPAPAQPTRTENPKMVQIADAVKEFVSDSDRFVSALPDQVREALVKKRSAAMIRNSISKLVPHYDKASGKFTVNEDELLNAMKSPKLRTVEGSPRIIDYTKEKRWLQRNLPQFSTAERLNIINGLIRINNSSNPVKAWGMFKDGVITLSSTAASGTLYHESFHAVMDMMLSDDERTGILNEAKKAYSTENELEAEERMAEAFRRYVQLEEIPVVGNFIKLFRRMKDFIRRIQSDSITIDKMFHDIASGRYSTASVNEKSDIQRHHESKLEYSNLDAERLEYLTERNITQNEYESMSPQEREILFRCM